MSNFSEVFNGLQPYQVTDFKGISGDSSDNLSGVCGIGPKTASELIKKFNSLENIYQNIDKLTASQKEKFIKHKENAIMCKQLSTIDININVNLDNEYFIKKEIDKDILKK
jgi:DNA polymerase-1